MDRVQAHVALATLDTAHICPMQPGLLRERLLAEVQREPQFSDPVAEICSVTRRVSGSCGRHTATVTE